MFRDKEIFHVKNHKGENESMQEQTRTPVFQNSDGTWGHLTKTVNPLICTIEYGSSPGFSSKEEAEKSYQKSMDSYQDLLSVLKKTRNVPFTFSEYLDYWIKEIQAPASNGSSTLARDQWVADLIIQPHLHKDMLLSCITPNYINQILESCQEYCSNGGYYAYKLLHKVLKSARENAYITSIDFQEIKYYPEPTGKAVFYSIDQLRKFLAEASKSSCYLEIQLALFCGLTKAEILGLKYTDFNKAKQILTVERIYTFANTEKGHQIKRLSGTKQNRILKIPSFIFPELSRRKKENKRILSNPTAVPGFTRYLCLGPTAQVKSGATLNQALRRITIATGLPMICMGDLRYMFARFLADQDFSIEAISSILGHTKLSTTLNFCSMFPIKEPKVGTIIGDSLDPFFRNRISERKGACP